MADPDNLCGACWREVHFIRAPLCDRLGIPRVCPHALRGLHATLAVKTGVSVRAVADALGHGSVEITKRHYITPGADRVGAGRELAALLAPSEPSQPQEAPRT